MSKINLRKTLGNLIVVLAGVLFYYFLNNFTLCIAAIKSVISIFSPFIWAFVIAYVLNPIVNYFENQASGMRHKRVMAIAMTLLLSALVCIVIFSFLLPELSASVQMLFKNLPSYAEDLGRLVTWVGQMFRQELNGVELVQDAWAELIAQANVVLIDMLPRAISATIAISSGAVNVLMTMVVSLYMLAGKDKLKRQFKKAVRGIAPVDKVDRVLELCHRANYVFSRFLGGKVIDSTIIGFLCFFSMLILGLEYSLLISVVVGITNVVPFFGPFIGAIPGILILFLVDPVQAVIFFVLILAIQQFDGNILGPYILGDSLGLSPLWVLFAIIVGGAAFGVAGIMVGVPAFALVYGVASEHINRQLKLRAGNGELVPEQNPPMEAGVQE